MATQPLAVTCDAPASSFFYAENGENAMCDASASIGKMLGYGDGTTEMTLAEAAEHWGAGPANDTMASNLVGLRTGQALSMKLKPAATQIPDGLD